MNGLKQEKLAAEALPSNVNGIEDEGLVIDFKNDQKEDSEQAHKHAHDRSGAPAGGNLTVFGVEGTKQIAQLSADCHNNFVVPSLDAGFVNLRNTIREVLPNRNNF